MLLIALLFCFVVGAINVILFYFAVSHKALPQSPNTHDRSSQAHLFDPSSTTTTGLKLVFDYAFELLDNAICGPRYCAPFGSDLLMNTRHTHIHTHSDDTCDLLESLTRFAVVVIFVVKQYLIHFI